MDKDVSERVETTSPRYKRQKLGPSRLEAPSRPSDRPARNRTEHRATKIPDPTPYQNLRVPDRTSGPDRPETDDGHYNFDIGDNFTPRCK